MIRTTRRAALAAALTAPAVARAQEGWSPTRPVTMPIGFAPGGSIDFVARLIAREISPLLGQNVVVENRAGAGGNLATQAVARAPADGHTIGFAAINLATNPGMMNVGYDPRNDIRMVGQISALPVVLLASNKSGFLTVRDVIAAGARDEVPFGSGGVGTSSHLGVALLARATGLKYQHIVFRGGNPAVQALIAGDTAAMFEPVAPYHFDLARAGQIRIILTMQDTKLEPMPEVPTIVDAGLSRDVIFQSWHGLLVRSGTPEPIVARLHAALNQAVNAPTVTEALTRIAIVPKTSAKPEDFQAFYLSELDRWGALIRETGMTAQ
ncbi:tripartite tricarboxylate transporter substrate binding protein [Roseomonas sp. CAU 1739]|uniref:Bug family tripartite tricarboxylate transporter substrate binding protein n=1 Tax=Roseomonas sp. CAU 1739 TaxID=3140364 RepID=UPI00325A44E3